MLEINNLLRIDKVITKKGYIGLKIFIKKSPLDKEWDSFYLSEVEINKILEYYNL